MMKIILFQPEIPQNTGNIIRTCAVTGCQLVLVEPLGFSLSDRWLKRAGLDYHEGVDICTIDDLAKFIETENKPFVFFSSKATNLYTQISYAPDHLLIFGSESKGFPANFFDQWPQFFVKIPMLEGKRCLNLATSVGIGVFEAWRQNSFT